MDRRQLFWLFFRFSGRVSRAPFFLAGLLIALAQLFCLYQFSQVPQDSPAGQGWALAFWLVFLLSLWTNVSLGVKRFHDFDKPGIFSISLFLPVVSIAVFLLLCLYPGMPGPNRYAVTTNSEG